MGKGLRIDTGGTAWSGHPEKKNCFLSSGWPKLWIVGRLQNLFLSFSFLFFGKKIIKSFKIKKKFPSRQYYTHPAAPPETTFFLRVASSVAT